MVLKRLAESAMKPYSIRSYWRMLTLWFRLGLYRFSRNREADKGKNKGKKTGQNEITPGGGTKEICVFTKGSFRRGCSLFYGRQGGSVGATREISRDRYWRCALLHFKRALREMILSSSGAHDF